MRILIALVALLLGAAGLAGAQTRVSVSVGVVAPPVYAEVVVGTPHYRVYRRPVVIVGPRYHTRYHHRRGRIVVVEHVHRHRHHVRHW